MAQHNLGLVVQNAFQSFRLCIWNYFVQDPSGYWLRFCHPFRPHAKYYSTRLLVAILFGENNLCSRLNYNHTGTHSHRQIRFSVSRKERQWMEYVKAQYCKTRVMRLNYECDIFILLLSVKSNTAMLQKYGNQADGASNKTKLTSHS
jgi:hypothetical protein